MAVASSDQPRSEMSATPKVTRLSPVSTTRTFAEANAAQRMLRRLGATGLGTLLFARVLHRVDKLAYKLTRGRYTFASALVGIQVVMLTTTGARSGLPRTVPVLSLQTADGFVVIASNFGQAHHPGWYYNLRADSRATLAIRGAEHTVCTVEASGDLRARIWVEALKVFPGYSEYERRASNREIALFVLEPRL